jgi:hypothetical protein
VFCARCWRSRDRREGPRVRAAGSDPLDAADTDAEREIGMPAIIE